MASQYDRVNFRGEPVTRRQRAAILAVEQQLGVEFTIYQGSWQPESSYSGTTHTDAGVMDIGLASMGNDAETRRITRKLREVGGQAAFLRGPDPFGGFMWHWHVCDLDTEGMDANARWQVEQYRLGFDGLQSANGDPVPYRPDPIVRFNYRAWVEAQKLRDRLRRQVKSLADRIRQLRRSRNQAKRKLDRLS